MASWTINIGHQGLLLSQMVNCVFKPFVNIRQSRHIRLHKYSLRVGGISRLRWLVPQMREATLSSKVNEAAWKASWLSDCPRAKTSSVGAMAQIGFSPSDGALGLGQVPKLGQKGQIRQP